MNFSTLQRSPDDSLHKLKKALKIKGFRFLRTCFEPQDRFMCGVDIENI
jgi:hypothetical protein